MGFISSKNIENCVVENSLAMEIPDRDKDSRRLGRQPAKTQVCNDSVV